jgi:3-keto-5-aminohexanoate cleavage enzyme
MNKSDYIWDYRNPYEWMKRVKKSAFPPMIIQVAITGGFQGKESNPNLPETAEEQADAVYAAYKAGASAVHVHARDPENYAKPSSSAEHFSIVNGLIRERCPDIIINNTTGGNPSMSAEERMGCLFAENKPDIASLNPGPFMVNYTQPGRPDTLPHPCEPEARDIASPITYGEVFNFAEVMNEKGIKPEIELFHPGQYWVIQDLIKRKLITPPFIIQLVMGFQTGTFPTPWNVLSLIQDLPEDSVFIVPGVGVFEVTMNGMGIILGGHIRVGLEDNLYYSRGRLAKSNAELVERAVRMGKEFNRTIATPAQAREMLGVDPI